MSVLKQVVSGFAMFFAIAMSPSISVAAASDKPNILVIWGDDVGYWNVSHNNRGMMGYKTPNIDRLADEGVAPKHLGISGIPVTTINYVGIYSSDTDRSARFYEVLGFSMEPDAESSDDSVPMRHFRGAGISLLPALRGVINPARLALEVDSMAQTKACLEYNNIAVTDVVEDESRSTIMIQDPDGNQIEFDRYW